MQLPVWQRLGFGDLVAAGAALRLQQRAVAHVPVAVTLGPPAAGFAAGEVVGEVRRERDAVEGRLNLAPEANPRWAGWVVALDHVQPVEPDPDAAGVPLHQKLVVHVGTKTGR